MVKGIKSIFWAYIEDYLLIAIKNLTILPRCAILTRLPTRSLPSSYLQSPLLQSRSHSLDIKHFLPQIIAVSPRISRWIWSSIAFTTKTLKTSSYLILFLIKCFVLWNFLHKCHSSFWAFISILMHIYGIF